jgi:hypothetical protein
MDELTLTRQGPSITEQVGEEGYHVVYKKLFQ